MHRRQRSGAEYNSWGHPFRFFEEAAPIPMEDTTNLNTPDKDLTALELFGRHARMVKRLYYYRSRRDAAISRIPYLDGLQIGYLALWRAASLWLLNPGDNFAGYAAQIIIRDLKSSANKTSYEVSVASDIRASLSQDTRDLITRALNTKHLGDAANTVQDYRDRGLPEVLSEELWTAIDTLEPRDRYILVQRVVHEVPSIVLAQMLGVSANRISQRYYHAIKKVRRALLRTNPRSTYVPTK